MICVDAIIKQRPMQKKLIDYQKSLERSSLSKNSIKVYLSAVYTYYNIYKEVSAKNLDSYKKYLGTHYNPRSANLHIIGLNRYLAYIGKPELRLHSFRFREKNYLDDIISYQDYVKLKRCLKDENDHKWYFVVWTLAATGVRISELVQLPDIIKSGYMEDHLNYNYPKDNTEGEKLRDYPWSHRVFDYNAEKMDMPIPAVELLKNTALEQNPAYRGQ